MQDGSVATYNATQVHHDGKVYVLHLLNETLRFTEEAVGGFTDRGALMVVDKDMNTFLREANTFEIQIQDGRVATFLEGDDGVRYMGDYYQSFESMHNISEERSKGWIEVHHSDHGRLLLIQTKMTSLVETMYLYKVE